MTCDRVGSDERGEENVKKFLTTATAALMALTASALADSGYYFSGLAGVSLMPNLGLKNTSTTAAIGLDNGYVYGGAFGYALDNGWRLEIDTLHQMATVNTVNGAAASGHLFTTSLMANATYDLPSYYSLTPYVGVGMGAMNIGGKVAGYSGSVWRPAYQLEAGLRYAVSPQLEWFGEYRFQQAAAAKFDGASDWANQHASSNLFNVGLTYHITP
jgi:opacity protein-like surface antigen